MQQISIIVSVMNSEKTLDSCIQSITTQTYPHHELIIMDGGSTDGSESIIKSYENKIAYWESKPDLGIYHAWNKALKHSRGEWICFLGADDYFWHKNVLADLYLFLKKAKETGIRIVYGQIVKINSKGQVLKQEGKLWNDIRWQMPHGMPLGLPHPGLMHHRSLFEEHGVFDETYKIAGDYEFLLRELKTGEALHVEDLISVAHQIGGTADSLKINAQIEVARARKKNGYRSVSWLWAVVFMRSLFRYLWCKLIRE